MYETDTFITLEFCEKPSGNCNGYSCLHFKENGTTVYIGTDLTSKQFYYNYFVFISTSLSLFEDYIIR